MRCKKRLSEKQNDFTHATSIIHHTTTPLSQQPIRVMTFSLFALSFAAANASFSFLSNSFFFLSFSFFRAFAHADRP